MKSENNGISRMYGVLVMYLSPFGNTHLCILYQLKTLPRDHIQKQIIAQQLTNTYAYNHVFQLGLPIE